MSGSTPQWERHVASRFRRFVDAQNQLEGLASRTTVRVRLGVPTKDSQHVPIVTLMAVAVDIRRIAVERAGERVVGIAFGELPMLDLVHRSSADLHSSLLAKNGQRP